MFRFLVLAFAAIFRPRALLIAENLCLRQQLSVLQRDHPRPRLSNADPRFWILASRWLGGWRNSLLILRPETVLSWQRRGWSLLDVAIFSPSEGRSPGGRGGTSSSHQAHVHGKCSVGPKTDPSRVARVARFGFKVSAHISARVAPSENDDQGHTSGLVTLRFLHSFDFFDHRP